MSQNQSFVYELAQGIFIGNLGKIASQLTAISEKWESLQIGKFDATALQKALNSDVNYFKETYATKMADKVSKVLVPQSVKDVLIRETADPKELREVLEMVDRTRNDFHRLSLVEMEGKTKPIPVKKDYFEIVSSSVQVVANVKELTLDSFSISIDSEEKQTAIQKLEEAAVVLTELTAILVSSGLYPADQVPLVLNSKVFKVEEGTYSIRKEALV